MIGIVPSPCHRSRQAQRCSGYTSHLLCALDLLEGSERQSQSSRQYCHDAWAPSVSVFIERSHLWDLVLLSFIPSESQARPTLALSYGVLWIEIRVPLGTEAFSRALQEMPLR